MNEEFLSVKEIAEKLKISKMFLHRAIRKGELKAYRLGNKFRIKAEDLENFLKKKKDEGD
ncbi:MAG: helix-turn-helix domain-containing protein [Deltaproteobacteria bacterium]|jgi:putative molybdopterin biosynthesis protein|nr:helix-turn-helix domain-containing protein [Deltaproteobacteria bacterium]